MDYSMDPSSVTSSAYTDRESPWRQGGDLLVAPGGAPDPGGRQQHSSSRGRRGRHGRISSAGSLLAGGMEAAAVEPRLALMFAAPSAQELPAPIEVTPRALLSAYVPSSLRRLWRGGVRMSPFKNLMPLGFSSRGFKCFVASVDPALCLCLFMQAACTLVVATDLYGIHPFWLVAVILVPPLAEVAPPFVGLAWLLLDHLFAQMGDFPLTGRVFVAVQAWSMLSSLLAGVIRIVAVMLNPTRSTSDIAVVFGELAALLLLKWLSCVLANFHVAHADLEEQRSYMGGTEGQEDFVRQRLGRSASDRSRLAFCFSTMSEGKELDRQATVSFSGEGQGDSEEVAGWRTFGSMEPEERGSPTEPSTWWQK